DHGAADRPPDLGHEVHTVLPLAPVPPLHPPTAVEPLEGLLFLVVLLTLEHPPQGESRPERDADAQQRVVLDPVLEPVTELLPIGRADGLGTALQRIPSAVHGLPDFALQPALLLHGPAPLLHPLPEVIQSSGHPFFSGLDLFAHLALHPLAEPVRRLPGLARGGGSEVGR